MHQMLEHAREAVAMMAGRVRAEMRADRMLQLALTHLVLVVGEAASRVSVEGRARHSNIPWTDAIATRNFIAHGYDRIDYEVVWDTVAEHFPPLVAALELALSSETG
ncbi:MAG TPA: HepT-like ribonuclease domain-containing protein [Methylomirabilota bacterium]|nr:HepT-like ribonuclease domain-containing protein [Methylomirabilota bacterium]